MRDVASSSYPLARSVTWVELDDSAVRVDVREQARRGVRERSGRRPYLRPELGLEALVPDREAGGGDDSVDELGLLGERGLVRDGGDRLAVLLESSGAPGLPPGPGRPRRPSASTQAAPPGPRLRSSR